MIEKATRLNVFFRPCRQQAFFAGFIKPISKRAATLLPIFLPFSGFNFGDGSEMGKFLRRGCEVGLGQEIVLLFFERENCGKNCTVVLKERGKK